MQTSTQRQLLAMAILSIVLARIQLPIQGFPVPIALTLVPPAILVFLAYGRAKIDPVACLLLIAICALGCLTFLANGGGSLPSLFLMIYLYSVTIVVVETTRDQKQLFDRSVVRLGSSLAIIGVVQFLAQWIAPPTMVFSWKSFVPSAILVEYNTLNELYYRAGIFKSNGFFFLESSQFGNFISRILALCIGSGTLPSAVILSTAVLLSYSGTSWISLALFAIIFILYAVMGKQAIPRWLLIFFGIASLAIIAAAPFLQLDRYLGRIDEVKTGSIQSSGGQRFNIPIRLTLQFLQESSAPVALFGLGPGTVDNYFGGTRFAVVASPWSKLIVEYGLLGFTLFIMLLCRIVLRSTSNRPLAISIILTFLFIDPGLLLAAAVYPLYLLFGCLVSRAESDPRRESEHAREIPHPSKNA